MQSGKGKRTFLALLGSYAVIQIGFAALHASVPHPYSPTGYELGLMYPPSYAQDAPGSPQAAAPAPLGQPATHTSAPAISPAVSELTCPDGTIIDGQDLTLDDCPTPEN
jgi:hypothetical protein